MSIAVMVDVADAVLTDINADPEGNFGEFFVARRSYGEWDDQLEEIDQLFVDVVPAKHPLSEAADRSGAVLHHVDVQIVVRRRLRRTAETKRFRLSEVDGLLQLNENIFNYFIQHPLSDLATATWRESKLVTDYVRRHLRDFSQYTGISQVTYEVIV